MRQSGCYPNVVTYNTLIECAPKHVSDCMHLHTPLAGVTADLAALELLWCYMTPTCVRTAGAGSCLFHEVLQDLRVMAGSRKPYSTSCNSARCFSAKALLMIQPRLVLLMWASMLQCVWEDGSLGEGCAGPHHHAQRGGPPCTQHASSAHAFLLSAQCLASHLPALICDLCHQTSQPHCGSRQCLACSLGNEAHVEACCQ